VKIRSEPEWELSIDPDTVRLFVMKARALSADVREDYEDGSDREIELEDQTHDGHHHDGLVEEETEDLTGEELRELIQDLNVDEASELVALVWLGRGDYDRQEWPQAVADAQQRSASKTADYLLGMPQLSEWLEAGLEALGA